MELTHASQARQVAENRSSGKAVTITEFPAGNELLRILGVNYVHTVTKEGGDLYLTSAGTAYREHLQPENWHELQWFREHRVRLEGTGLVYAVQTRPVEGEPLGLVVKYSRVGEDVPIDTRVIENMLCCEFNGPFEEFGLVEELRHSRRGSPDSRMETQLPLAIYVPPDKTQPSQTGRFQWRIARKVAQHPGVSLDIMREYLMVYSWLPGLDAWQAHQLGFLSADEVRELNTRATDEVRAKGFTVLDMKPNHVIVEVDTPERLRTEQDRIRTGLIDYELLERTEEYWQEIKADRRETYQRAKRELLSGEDHDGAEPLPPNIHRHSLLGVDYLHGRAESTGGQLWVVGADPSTFEFYLPERWRTTPHVRLSETHETYFTTSKDNVRLVWKVSRVGERPEVATFGPAGFRALAHGFNSPFEEFAIAWWLRRHGVPTIVPRAIYRTGHRSQLDESLFEPSRYESHASLRAPDGGPVLEQRRNYITIWDYWEGSDSEDVDDIVPVFRSVSASRAVERGLLTHEEADALADGFRASLGAAGVEAIHLVPDHVLVFIGADERLARDEEGRLSACLTSFQYLRLPDTLEPPRFIANVT